VFLHVNEIRLARNLVTGLIIMRVESDLLGGSLLILGAVVGLVRAGILLFFRLPFLGRLQGRISFQRDGLSFFFPIVMCVIFKYRTYRVVKYRGPAPSIILFERTEEPAT